MKLNTQVPNPSVETALTSTSMERALALPASFVLGKSVYVPFKPGGLDDVLLSPIQPGSSGVKGLRSILPGFLRGLRLPGEELEVDYLATLEGSLPSRATANGDIVMVFLFLHTPIG